MKGKKMLAWLLALAMVCSLLPAALADDAGTDAAAIEQALNLANNPDQEWTYTDGGWVLSVVSAVYSPVLPDYEGVSVCVPGAYVVGIDQDGNGTADLTAQDAGAAQGVHGSLVIDDTAAVTSPNGQTYTARTCPVILTTGAAGYGDQANQKASTTYVEYGYVAVACGNRGKQSKVTDETGTVTYTGDAPCCLADQKAAARYVKYNILLGNLPGSVDYFVSTGGSGGGAHAAMFAATSNSPDYYDYQIEVGAVGVYRLKDGSYSTTVTIDGQDYALSDGAWGCVAYSAITSLAQADLTQAFEYWMDSTYSFNSPFQAQLAEYLSQAYMADINAQGLTIREAQVGFDLDGDGSLNSTVALTIDYDPEAYPETGGYGGTYLDLYLAEFTQNLQWYLDNLDYAEGWTWFHADGTALTDTEVAAMTSADRVSCFLQGLYAKASTGGMGGPGGAGGTPPDLMGGTPPDLAGGTPPDLAGGTPPDLAGGGPSAGTTQSASGSGDSANYDSFEAMAAAYASDREELSAGDRYGKDQVALYDPLQYIGSEFVQAPAWTRIVMGAVEGDISVMNSLNLQLAWLNAGTDAVIEWQWDGGHVPSEILGESLGLYVDQMYGKYVSGTLSVKAAAEPITANGTASEPTGTDLSDWVRLDDQGKVSFTLADALIYRNTGATKAVPGFDTIDLGQEDYVFGSPTVDARHWDSVVSELLNGEASAAVLKPLFNLDQEAQAVLSPQTIAVDGEAVSVQAYNIGGYNYIQLRDLAVLLNGTSCQFAVDYDEAQNAVILTSGESYSGTLSQGGNAAITGTLGSQTICQNGSPLRTLAMYNLNGRNYVQLRSLAGILGFAVDYQAESNTANILTQSD